MKKERNINQEILAGIKEIRKWQQGKEKLKTTYVSLPHSSNKNSLKLKLPNDLNNFNLQQDQGY